MTMMMMRIGHINNPIISHCFLFTTLLKDKWSDDRATRSITAGKQCDERD